MIKTNVNGKQFQIDSQGFFSPSEECALEDWLHAMKAQDAAQKRHRSLDTINTHRKALREKTQQSNGEGVLVYCLTREYVRMLCFTLMLGSFYAAAEARKTSIKTGQSQAIRFSRKEMGEAA